MWQRIAPALYLFLLAPFVGEFLLGALPITMLPALVVLAPMYGGGVLLVRELARRRRLGWPGIALLGLAYAVVEEGLVTRSLFDTGYAGGGLLQYGWIPALGIGSWWTVFVLTLHVAWSVCVPVALAEAAVPARAQQPWLGRAGLAVTAVVFLLGAAAGATTSAYRPSAGQLAGTVLVVLVLVGAALLRPRTERPPVPAAAPGPWPAFGAAFAAGSAFWLAAVAMGVLDDLPAPVVVTGFLALAAATVVVVWRWSGRAGWGVWHRFALAAGGLLAYAWHGFAQAPAVPVADAVKLAGNAVFALIAVGLLALTAARLRRGEVSPARAGADGTAE